MTSCKKFNDVIYKIIAYIKQNFIQTDIIKKYDTLFLIMALHFFYKGYLNGINRKPRGCTQGTIQSVNTFWQAVYYDFGFFLFVSTRPLAAWTNSCPSFRPADAFLMYAYIYYKTYNPDPQDYVAPLSCSNDDTCPLVPALKNVITSIFLIPSYFNVTMC